MTLNQEFVVSRYVAFVHCLPATTDYICSGGFQRWRVLLLAVDLGAPERNLCLRWPRPLLVPSVLFHLFGVMAVQ